MIRLIEAAINDSFFDSGVAPRMKISLYQVVPVHLTLRAPFALLPSASRELLLRRCLVIVKKEGGGSPMPLRGVAPASPTAPRWLYAAKQRPALAAATLPQRPPPSQACWWRCAPTTDAHPEPLLLQLLPGSVTPLQSGQRRPPCPPPTAEPPFFARRSSRPQDRPTPPRLASRAAREATPPYPRRSCRPQLPLARTSSPPLGCWLRPP